MSSFDFFQTLVANYALAVSGGCSEGCLEC